MFEIFYLKFSFEGIGQRMEILILVEHRQGGVTLILVISLLLYVRPIQRIRGVIDIALVKLLFG